jgi:mannose-6-phosphate isomerase-like protein (cupin superfamily)
MMENRRPQDVPTAPGKLAEVWFGVTQEIKTPRPVRLADATANAHAGGTISLFVHTDCWDSGLMFVAPGHDTAVFSMEDIDDGSADEWYGPTQEFYYIVAGEFTVSYDTDAGRLRRKESPSYQVRAGEYAVHPTGWKFQIQCTSPTPGTFLWCKNIPPGHAVEERLQLPLDPVIRR